MIEFKAECGHTVRAKDEDAGGVVRCTYCGRNAAVPDNRNADLDFLLSEIPAQTDTAPGRRRRRWPKLLRRRARTPGRFDVFSIIFRMCYLAILLAVMIVVVKTYVWPLFQQGVGWHSTARRTDAGEKPTPSTTPAAPTPSRRPGLSSLEGPIGLYVGSTPPGAHVFCLDMTKAPASGRVHQMTGCVSARANGSNLRLPDGIYLVEVAVAWNDPALNDPGLPMYPQYRAFRRTIENAPAAEGARLMEEFFVPDEASAVLVDKTADQVYLVRQYRNVVIRNGRSNGVQALFLPRIPLPGRPGFSIAQLVTNYLPREKAYNFDEKYVRSELDFYEVPEADRLFVLEALARIGVMPYVTPDGRTRLFRVGIHDGTFTTKVIREAKG
jgi:hypothetical protein